MYSIKPECPKQSGKPKSYLDDRIEVGWGMGGAVHRHKQVCTWPALKQPRRRTVQCSPIEGNSHNSPAHEPTNDSLDAN